MCPNQAKEKQKQKKSKKEKKKENKQISEFTHKYVLWFLVECLG